MEVRVIADYGDLCGEGPLWNAQEQALYWTDLARTRLYRFDWEAQQHRVFSETMQVSGYAFNRAGGIVVTNISGIWLWNPPAEPVLLAGEAEGHRCCMNDCVADPEGRVYSGTYYKNQETGIFEKGAGCLMRIDNDGSVHVADDGFCLSNGLAFSPDLRTLFYVDSAERVIYAFDYRRSDGALSNRRVFVRVPREEGFPDGITVDAQGFLWCAHWFGDALIRYDPDGMVERRIAMPASQVSSVTFGGPDFTDLFVTSAGLLDSTYLAPTGYDAAKHVTGGPVYHLQAGVQGREEFRANIARRA
jgi:sugar lactone lactonase YvrE